MPLPFFQPAGYWFMGMPNPVAYAPQALWGKMPQVSLRSWVNDGYSSVWTRYTAEANPSEY